jgi:hypothetical protein
VDNRDGLLVSALLMRHSALATIQPSFLPGALKATLQGLTASLLRR